MLFTPLQWLFLLLGVTWAFHLSFTIWMIPKGQTDLTYHGVFFSLVIIYMMNVLLLTVFLVAAAHELSFAGYRRDLIENAHGVSALMVQWGHEIWRYLPLWHARGNDEMPSGPIIRFVIHNSARASRFYATSFRRRCGPPAVIM